MMTQPSSMSSSPSTTHYPNDRYSITLLAVFLLGLTSMLPWNALVTANDYWMYKFRDVNGSSANSSGGTDPDAPMNETQRLFISNLAIVCTTVYFVVLLGNAWIQRISNECRVSWALVLTVMCVASVTAFVKVNTDSWQYGFLILTLTTGGVTACVVAILTGSAMALCGFLPPRMMAALSTGASVGSVLCALAQIGCLVLSLSEANTALLYFCLALAMLIVTLVFWKAMEWSTFYRFYRNKAGSAAQILDLSQPSTGGVKHYWSIFKEGWHFNLTALVVTCVSMPIFPGLAYVAVSTTATSTLAKKLFVPLSCTLAFNAGDMVGRYSEVILPYNPKRRSLLLWLCAARVVIIPLLLLCNVAPQNRPHFPVVFHSDAILAILMIVGGLSNGYLLNAALVNTPKTTALENQELSASIAACSVAVGSILGSILSYSGLALIFKNS